MLLLTRHLPKRLGKVLLAFDIAAIDTEEIVNDGI